MGENLHIRKHDHEVEVRVVIGLDRWELSPGDSPEDEARKIVESLGGVTVLDAFELL